MVDVLFVIAEKNFRDEELFDTKEVIEKAGLTAIIGAKTTGIKKGVLGKSAEATVALKNVNVLDYKAIIFVGGAGASAYFEDAVALIIAKLAAKHEKIVAAICIAPIILLNAGILKGKNVTVWEDTFHSYSKKLETKGAKYTGNDVEIDGNIITANGPQAARKFGDAVVKAIKK
jgi:protease I